MGGHGRSSRRILAATWKRQMTEVSTRVTTVGEWMRSEQTKEAKRVGQHKALRQILVKTQQRVGDSQWKKEQVKRVEKWIKTKEVDEDLGRRIIKELTEKGSGGQEMEGIIQQVEKRHKEIVEEGRKEAKASVKKSMEEGTGMVFRLIKEGVIMNFTEEAGARQGMARKPWGSRIRWREPRRGGRNCGSVGMKKTGNWSRNSWNGNKGNGRRWQGWRKGRSEKRRGSSRKAPAQWEAGIRGISG